MSTPIYLANDKYSADLSQKYTVGDAIIYVTSVPDNVPTLIVLAKGTTNETVFEITGKTLASVTGVTRKKGSNVDHLALTPATCLNNEELINQYRSYLGISWKGTYVAETTYEVQDGVTYNGSSYICTAESTGNLPTDTDYWQELAEKGDTGDTGEQGIQGEVGETGATGASITSVAFVANDMVFTKDDASTVTLVNALIDLKGDTGEQGIQGETGEDGLGVPTGGSTGEVLKKASNDDNDTEWGDAGLDSLQVVLSSQVFS